jgi:hypothetical protein
MFKKIVIVLLFFSALSLAQGSEQSLVENEHNGAKEIKSPTDAYDCTVVRIDALDETKLTIAERIKRMDASLLDSIDQHDTCIDQVVNNNAASRSGAGSGSTGEDSETGSEATFDASKDSDDSSDQGKEAKTEQVNSDVEPNSQQKQVENDTKLEGNGAKNQDIAPQDNDSAVCRLLKDELKVEKDPKRQSELRKIVNNYNCRG